MAALQGDERPVLSEDYTSVLRVLDERRRSLLSAKSRLVNQLHAILRQLLPGGADVDLDSEKASLLLRKFVPDTPTDVMRHRIAPELVGDLRRLDVQLADISERSEITLAECGSTLTTIFGCGPVTAGRIIARTGNPFRFATDAAFATYSGTAPVQIASADSNRHRLSRDGDRVLNSTIHVIAVCQGRNANSPGYAYVNQKIESGMTRRSAMRCLKRQVAKKVWRTMCQDHRRWEAREQLTELTAG